MSEFIEVCEKAARAGGEVLLKWRGRIRAHEKGPADLVTEADYESQQVIRDVLLGRFPDHGFLGEEDASGPSEALGGGPTRWPDRDFCWIVDPLDGTTNYVHRLQPYAVSVALARADQVLAGVVYDPVADECYRAATGEGAFLNGRRLQTSDCDRLADALVAASFPARTPRGSIDVARFVEVLHACQAVRRIGSAALNLAYVAAGRLDAYFAASVKPWDVAAGVLLVREAGGAVTDMSAAPLKLLRPVLAASSTRDLHGHLLRTLAQAGG